MFFIWAGTSSGIRQKSWPGRVGKFLKELGIEKEIECCNSKQEMISLVRNNCICKCVSDWHSTINRETGRRGVGGNKLKVWSTVKIRGTRVPQTAIVPVGRSRPYSIIILNMCFIPKASLRASSQITASSHILERHL